MSINAGVFPVPEQQFFDASGKPLAGGSIYFCVAGTSCPGNPQDTYTDATGATPATNPVVLDAAGRASIWLSGLAYKVTARDVNGATQWTQDNVQIPGLALLSGVASLSSLTVTGDASIGGDLAVSGDSTLTGDLGVGGTLTVGSLDVTGAFDANTITTTGDVTVGGDLTVDGATTLTGAVTVAGGEAVTGGLATDTLTVDGVSLADTITAAFAAAGSPSALNGTLAVSGIATETTANGNWVIFTFGSVSGTRVRVAQGSGTANDGDSVAVPSGFNTTNLIVTPSLRTVATSSGNQLDNITLTASGAVITAQASDNTGHNFDITANWSGVAWITGF
jgi:cytoskeletal protein CcmA (bactofilin family)